MKDEALRAFVKKKKLDDRLYWRLMTNWHHFIFDTETTFKRN